MILDQGLCMDEYCNPNCLFLFEPGCTGCRRCTYCGRRLYRQGNRSRLTFDHVFPWISGGTRVVPACEKCNKSKWAMGLKAWLRWVKDNRTPLWRRIVEFNKNKRNKIAQVVREVRDE